jgi:hypothetical protein
MEDNVLSMLLNNSTILSRSFIKDPPFLRLYYSDFNTTNPNTGGMKQGRAFKAGREPNCVNGCE